MKNNLTTNIQENIQSENPLLKNPCAPYPPFPFIKNKHIHTAMRYVLQQANKDFREAVHKLNGWKLLNAQQEVLQKIENVWQPLEHLLSVKDNKQMRKICDQERGNVIRFCLKITQNKKIYHETKKLYQQLQTSTKNQTGNSDFDCDQQKRVLYLRLQQAQLAGVSLGYVKRILFSLIVYFINNYQTRFANHLLDANAKIAIILDQKKDLQGLPQSICELAEQNYREYAARENITVAKNKKWRFDLSLPLFLPFMQYSEHRDLREKLYRLHASRASSGNTNNRPLINKILRLRNVLAKLLNFDDYSSLMLSTRMAKHPQTVLDFLQKLRSYAFPEAQRDFADLQVFAQKNNNNDSDFRIQLWDIAYYERKLKNEQIGLDQQKLRSYFPYSHVLLAMFSIANRLFNISFEKTSTFTSVTNNLNSPNSYKTKSIPSWHEDVSYFHVRDQKTNHTIAGLYIDPYSRPAQKRDGAWMNECLEKKQGQNPVAYLICNFTPPVNGQKSLLTFQEVTTLFHEFGHTLQHMLTTINHTEISGLNGIEWDAVELASQFMENWCYQPQGLQLLGKHYKKPSTTLPESLSQAIIRSRSFHSSLQIIRQIRFSLIDLMLHTDYPKKSIDKIIAEINAKTTLLPPLVEDQFLCSFAHIFAGSYAAGYYSYKWAEVLSADAFMEFTESKIVSSSTNSKEQWQNWAVHGQKFRDTILALGGSRQATEIYELFRGKQATIDALLIQSGLPLTKPVE